MRIMIIAKTLTLHRQGGFETHVTEIAIRLIDAVRIIEDVTGRKASVTFMEKQKGDAECTNADITKARKLLGFGSKTSIEDGLRCQIEAM